MSCIFCFDIPTAPIVAVACRGYECRLIACSECIETMVKVCRDTVRSMPTCECRCEYTQSQLLPVLSKEIMEMYIMMCKRNLELDNPTSTVSRVDHAAMIDAVRQRIRKNMSEALPEAVVHTMIISGLEKRLIAREQKNSAFKAPQRLLRPCVSFTCKGKLVDNDQVLKCHKCSLLVCKTCDVVRSAEDHTCRKEDMDTVDALKDVRACPKCSVPTTRGSGCVFVTCPYCNTKFDSTTGMQSAWGGHKVGEYKPLPKHRNLADMAIDEEGRDLLNAIQDVTPTTTRTPRPDIRYQDQYKKKIYTDTVNRIYELRDSKVLNNQTLAKILKYLNQL